MPVSEAAPEQALALPPADGGVDAAHPTVHGAVESKLARDVHPAGEDVAGVRWLARVSAGDGLDVVGPLHIRV